ncbi:hypothetical protein C9F11_43305 (plasmid) [Streptomyces sp. YIM 121038]|uniref:hypothetical protein n=1 Tax=Streptomyces sp. YIM 121038 TaxID=2136401 RepID=UPI001110958A|nr:hypothetical protein [Streptomyces sp. YIM 121038]QCX82241.1 hypothetical protein C9F11_43305 [Streptomyces sp. YIM 121038]
MRCLLQLRTARAAATTGDDRAAKAALTASERAWDRVRPEQTPAAISWLSVADLRVDAGRCWLDLGNLPQADAAFTEGLAALAPHRQRTRAVFQTSQAESALTAGDIDRAVHHIQSAAATARASGSSRCASAVDSQRRRIIRAAPQHRAVTALG